MPDDKTRLHRYPCSNPVFFGHAALVSSNYYLVRYSSMRNRGFDMTLPASSGSVLCDERGLSGFVNCAADDTAPFRLARTLRNRLKQKLAVSFLLANAHVASCGWLGIHEAHLQAFGFGAGIIPTSSFLSFSVPATRREVWLSHILQPAADHK